MYQDHSAEPGEMPLQGPLEARAARLRDALQAMREMIGRAEVAGVHTTATALRLLLQRHESELARTERSLSAVERARRI